MKRKKTHGFTLVELLVVIAIIGILAAIALVSFTQSQRQARDTARKSDLKQYQTALENFANSHNGLFPAHQTSFIMASEDLCETLGLGSCPEDPNYDGSNDQYYYYRTPDPLSVTTLEAKATGYFLWVPLESESGKYWVVCSNGQSGTASAVSGTCPL